MKTPATPDDLLALSVALAENLVRACAVDTSPYGRALWHRMTHPVMGDTVLVQSIPVTAELVTRIGVLKAIEHRRRAWNWTKKWDEVKHGPCPTERVYVLMLASGTEFRWWNVSLMALPQRDRAVGVWEAVTPQEEASSLFRAPTASP